MFRSKPQPLTERQKDLILDALRIYGFGEGSLMDPLRARIRAGEPLAGNQELVLKALLARTRDSAGPALAPELDALLKRRYS